MVNRPCDREISAMHKMHQKNFTTREIASFFDVSSATVSYWLRKSRGRCATTGSPPRRNVKAVDKRRKCVRKLVLQKNPRGEPKNVSAMSIKRLLQKDHDIVVSKQTVLADLHALHFCAVVRPKVCCPREDYEARKEFASRCRWKDAKRIVFSDEKVFTTNDEGSRTQWVTKGVRPTPRLKMRWPAGRVMVWAAIGFNFRKIVVLPNVVGADRNHFRLTADSYVRKCLATVVPFLQQTGRTFQQDGAACHTAATTLKYLEGKGVKVMQTPPRSPDMNPIENLWATMARKVTLCAPTNRAELVDAVQKVWAELDASMINNLVSSFHTRCVRVFENNGAM